jgi:hypothetical protein
LVVICVTWPIPGMDGTPSGYYYLESTAPNTSQKWTLSLFGGGECFDKASCTSHLEDELGSSKYFKPFQYFGAYAQFACAESNNNPGFATWNHVQIPYCSQDLHMGTRTQADASTWGLYFSGHLIFSAVLDALDARGLVNATDILLSGASAGGIGVWPHLNYLQGRYPHARVTGAPIAGFYDYAYPYTGPNATRGYF